MTKIKLSLENLRVESFTTSTAEGGQGTVFGRAKSVDVCGSAQETGCIPGCETWYGMGICSIDDGCISSPHAMTLPCNGCAETDGLGVRDGGELG
jgi:hypothetical protein